MHIHKRYRYRERYKSPAIIALARTPILYRAWKIPYHDIFGSNGYPKGDENFETETNDHRCTAPGFIKSDDLAEKTVNIGAVITHCTRVKSMCLCVIGHTKILRYHIILLSSQSALTALARLPRSQPCARAEMLSCARLHCTRTRTRQSRHSQRSLDHDGFPNGRAYLFSVVTFVSTPIQMWVNGDNAMFLWNHPTTDKALPVGWQSKT